MKVASPVLNGSYVLSDDDRAAFRGLPQRRQFASGALLHRFVTRGETSAEGPWWLLPFDLANLRAHASRNGLTLAQVARPLLAVRFDWSPSMDQLVTVRLLCDAIAWIGPARHQAFDEQPSNVVWIGGMQQVFLPNILADGKKTPPEVRQAHAGLPVPRAKVVAHERI